MKLPEIQLDDRRFQDLVSEARLKITRACPEWTEHNVSDPGITLIELFAWMTEMTIYRLNRVPDKLHVTLLELLGIRLDGPSAAQTSLRFRLAEPPREPLLIPGGHTEVGHAADGHRGVDHLPGRRGLRGPADSSRPPTRCSAAARSRASASPTAWPSPRGADQLAFASPPAVGDALYLGFEEPIGRLLIEVDVDASQARGAGVNPEDPPLRWEVSQGDGEWLEARVLEDLTGGFNYGSGTVELELPPRSAIQPLAGPPAALAALPDRRQDPPRRRRDDLLAGARDLLDHRGPDGLPPAGHPRRAGRVRGDRGVRRHARSGLPAAQRAGPQARMAGETLEVQDPESGDWARWELRDDFVGSTEFDRHFCLDVVSGEVEFGPAIRETDGGWTQYGAVPPKGAVLRFTRYRHGGGRLGNVTAGTVTVLKSTLAGHRHGHQPGSRGRRRRRRAAHARPRARVDGDPQPLPRGHRGGLRVPGRRGEPARGPRGLHPAARGRRRAAAHRPAA